MATRPVADMSPEDILATFTLPGHARTRPDKIAVIDGDDCITYADLNKRINQVAHLLKYAAPELGPGKVAAVCVHNCVEFVEVTQAVSRLGGICVPVSYRFTGDELVYILTHSEAQVVVVDEHTLATVRGVYAQCPALEKILVVNEEHPEDDITLHYPSRRAKAPVDPPPPPPGEGTSMRYTSGTTGNPKGVYRKPPADRIATLKRTITAFQHVGYTEEDVHIVCCPLYHAAPPAFALFTLMAGGTIVIMKKFDPEEFLALIEKHKATTSAVVPTILMRLAELPDDIRARYDLSSLRQLITGAAPCPQWVKKTIVDNYGPVLAEYYGSTDAGLNTYLPNDKQLSKLGSIGTPFPGNELKLLREDGTECDVNEVGELYIKNEGLLSGYYKNDDATQDSFRDGFFASGDLAYKDADGYFYIADRKKDMVISGGVNIYPAEVEKVISAHPGVHDVAVIGIPDDQWGEKLLACIERTPGRTVTEDEIRALCTERLADFKRPRVIEFVDALPRGPEGKLFKRKIRDRYWEGRARRV